MSISCRGLSKAFDTSSLVCNDYLTDSAIYQSILNGLVK